LGEVLDKLFASTWKTEGKTGAPAEVQRVVNQVVLLNTMGLAVNESAIAQARSLAFFKLNELKGWLQQKWFNIEDEDRKAHFFAAASLIQLFQQNPQQYVFTLPLSAPPGAPIGMDD
jgi:hypothetical protein